MVKAYHATTAEAAEKIETEGFKIPRESEEFYQGRGVYFAAGQRAIDVVQRHGEVILEVELDTDDFEDIDYGEEEIGETLGTWAEFLESRMALLEDEIDPQPLQDQFWKEYIDLAEERRKEALALGKKGWKRGSLDRGWMELVVADPETARNLKTIRTAYIGKSKERFVLLRRPNVRQYHRRSM